MISLDQSLIVWYAVKYKKTKTVFLALAAMLDDNPHWFCRRCHVTSMEFFLFHWGMCFSEAVVGGKVPRFHVKAMFFFHLFVFQAASARLVYCARRRLTQCVSVCLWEKITSTDDAKRRRQSDIAEQTYRGVWEVAYTEHRTKLSCGPLIFDHGELALILSQMLT